MLITEYDKQKKQDNPITPVPHKRSINNRFDKFTDLSVKSTRTGLQTNQISQFLFNKWMINLCNPSVIRETLIHITYTEQAAKHHQSVLQIRQRVVADLCKPAR